MKKEQEAELCKAEVAKEYYCNYDVLEEQLNRTSKEYIYIKRCFVLRWLHMVTKSEATICCLKKIMIGKKCFI